MRRTRNTWSKQAKANIKEDIKPKQKTPTADRKQTSNIIDPLLFVNPSKRHNHSRLGGRRKQTSPIKRSLKRFVQDCRGRGEKPE
ncbi:hypothetical protein M419DRAFT_119685 [Trichoderma reesei RUT C-30]|uniref:Uncharacterized protein n=1 Tax=Hypocrea jecorina (strain ATCC 56765 / BCRC 32924 / NRRL 11460 / Rut C-30) TaxID=1344414 RepID=A0A024S4X5_HYPJR|nr:hypothetical protein M419DRAFT_119685 [Trichoderma reesei RUT C-30]